MLNRGRKYAGEPEEIYGGWSSCRAQVLIGHLRAPMETLDGISYQHVDVTKGKSLMGSQSSRSSQDTRLLVKINLIEVDTHFKRALVDTVVKRRPSSGYIRRPFSVHRTSVSRLFKAIPDHLALTGLIYPAVHSLCHRHALRCSEMPGLKGGVLLQWCYGNRRSREP